MTNSLRKRERTKERLHYKETKWLNNLTFHTCVLEAGWDALVLDEDYLWISSLPPRTF
jgi:hypothetical protein